MAKEKDEKAKKPKPKPKPGRRNPAGNIGPANRWTPGEPRPDILFLIIDDLVAADLTASRAPNWTAFKAKARNFTNCYTMPICSQSRACMMYGRYGKHIGTGYLVEFSPFVGPEPLASEVTMPQLMQAAGYSTQLVGKWHSGRNPTNVALGPIGAPQVRGFQHWRAGAPENIGNGGGTYTSWLRIDDFTFYTETEYATIAQVDEAAARWATMTSPRFLNVCISAPHAPFHVPPAEVLGGYTFTPDPSFPNRELYQLMIRSADWALGRILSMPGVSDAIVIVCSDNGTPDGAAGTGQDPDRMKGSAYDLGSRVPLAIRGPSSMVNPGTDARLVHLVDVPATILRRANLSIPAGWDSADMLASSTANVRTGAIMEATDPGALTEQGAVGYGAGVVSAGYKLIRHTTLSGGDIAQDELYNLATDPGELTPLSLAGNAAIVTQLRALIDAP